MRFRFRTLILLVAFQSGLFAEETQWLSNTRQLTFEGRRAGEGYFGPRGQLMVFQSERLADNPFYQIYLMDRETGDTERISPGYGKTTCAWIHPDRNRILFASTHDDPQSKELQREELEFRASGKERRYAWDYDPSFELYSYDRAQDSYERLTSAKGYDAEASYSPDGEWIAFASNRRAYSEELRPGEAEAFKLDPAVMNDIYLMRADGSELRQLTQTLGYDGGPFFSPDGQRICWRRFAPNGATAEIMTMAVDGTDKRQLTRLEAIEVLGTLFSPLGQVPHLHHQPSWICKLRTLRRRCRGNQGTLAYYRDGRIRWPAGIHARWNAVSLDQQSEFLSSALRSTSPTGTTRPCCRNWDSLSPHAPTSRKPVPKRH